MKNYTISVSGKGEAIGIPDIAKIQLGYSVEKYKVSDAQKDNSEKMNIVIEKLKKDYSIESKDIKTTNYNINPQYNWNEGKQLFRGYRVSQNLDIKIRDISKLSDILDLAGTLGLNQVGSLNFDIDNKDKLEQEAREKAIKAAKEKAEALAEVAGLKLGKIVSFYENNGSSNDDNYRYLKMEDSAMSGGPSIEAGSSEIIINATIEYEIL